MNNSVVNTKSVLDLFVEGIGEEKVITDAQELERLKSNTSEFAPPAILGLLQPTDVEDVKTIVQIAKSHQVSLYPYSTGMNWGLGSKLPTSGDCFLVSLAFLNSIREVNENYHYAIVEPGVTQQQLYDYIEQNGYQLQLNVTGSSPHSSIVGNILEKGTGFRNHRLEDIRGMEVICGNGDLLRTGFWHQPSEEKTIHHFKYGVGPYLDGLFLQSNYGLVTGVVMNLIPKREDLWMLTCQIPENDLGYFLSKVNLLYRDHYLLSSMHIGNDTRTKIADPVDTEEVPKWTAWATISGDRAMLEFSSREIASRLIHCCKDLNFYSSEQLNEEDPDPFLREIYLLHNGQPSYLFIRAMQKSIGDIGPFNQENVDEGRYGMLCCLPIIPFDGKEAEVLKDLIYEICGEFNFIPALTFNPMNDLYLEVVINLYFDRGKDEEIMLAQRCNERLHHRLYEAGYRFYRFDIEMMQKYIDPDSTFWQTVAKLKDALDPERIIAPQRYNLE